MNAQFGSSLESLNGSQSLYILFFAVALSIGLGLLLGRYTWPRQPIAEAALAELRSDHASRVQECASLRLQYDKLHTDRARIDEQSQRFSHECAVLTARLEEMHRKIEYQGDLLQNAESARVASQERANRDAGEIARLIEREKTLAEKVEAQLLEVHQLNEKLTLQFEIIATRILKANSNQLSEASNQTLSTLIDPLKEKISEFQKKVEDTYSSEQREVISLKEQIKLALETSQTVGKQADDLAKALRGNSQQLGRWGELVLERILEDAGLQEGREFITQGRGLQMKSEEGGAVRPDVIVKLPEGRSLIVDSKVPLAAYERLVTISDDGERTLCRGQFLRDVRKHIDDLAGKRYQDNEKLQAHEFALLFMPVESSLYEAITGDPSLFTFAWNKNVVLIGPSTLLATMRTVASIWRHEKQAENAQRIAKDAGLLLDKLSNSIEDLNRVGAKLAEATDSHNKALGRLFTGKGNALSIGQRIRNAGVKSKHVMANPMVDDAVLAKASYDDDDASEDAELESLVSSSDGDTNYAGRLA